MPFSVTFAFYGNHIASSRLRALIPQIELKKLGVKQGRDILVYGKHALSFEQIRGFKKYVFDICDNHFKTPELEKYYREHAARADLITCNSEVMKQIIKEETGREAEVVLEPYESEEREPSIGDRLYWFGHQSNLQDLERILSSIDKEKLFILTGDQWSMDRHNKMMKLPLIVVIPTGKSMAKSENRMVEAIRQGKYVCAEYLPAYEPFSEFFQLGHIQENIEQALSNPQKSIERIKAAQDYVREKYSPETIAKQWLGVLNEHFQSR